MKKIFLPLFACIALLSCATTTERVEAGTIVANNDEYWNDADIQIVCRSLIADCIASPRVAKFELTNGRAPTCVLGTIKNESAEHIDTSIVSKKMQTAIINSGVMEFVADKTERAELREEVAQQQENSSDETKKMMEQEEAADFMLSGTVKTDVQLGEKNITRAYFVYATLTDLESHRIIWQGEDDSVKKIVPRKKSKL